MVQFKFNKSLKVRHMTFAFCQVTIIASLLIPLDQSFALQCATLLSGSVASPNSPATPLVNPEERLKHVLPISEVDNALRVGLLTQSPNSSVNAVALYIHERLSNSEGDRFTFPLVLTILENMPKGSNVRISSEAPFYFPQDYMIETYIGNKWKNQTRYQDIAIIMELLYDLRGISAQEAAILKASVDDLLINSAIDQKSTLMAAIRTATNQLISRASGSIHGIVNKGLRDALLDQRDYDRIVTELEQVASQNSLKYISFDDLVRVLENMPTGTTKANLPFSNSYFPKHYMESVMNLDPTQAKQSNYLDVSVVMRLLSKLKQPVTAVQEQQLRPLIDHVLENSLEYLSGNNDYQGDLRRAIQKLLHPQRKP
ncbi:MAG: hypothetical protein JNM39_19020 [Bdellovibrionaceae bacterium]|nr:hypothetical protein [Pseudobdellovibrionaceae bacterium]